MVEGVRGGVRARWVGLGVEVGRRVAFLLLLSGSLAEVTVARVALPAAFH